MLHRLSGLGSAGLLVTLALARSAVAQDAPPPPVPQGVEVLTRGPVHEAFATPTAEPQASPTVPKAPPQPLQELPPDEKPEGAVIWVPGYWHWDDERQDYLWVSGVWRSPPPGKRWVPGYWRPEGGQWQWVPGFWTVAANEQAAESDVTYLPAPPATPETAPPGAPPSQDVFYIPGSWEWRGSTYVWRAGYWGRVQPGYVWVSAHYRWSPSGYIYIAGYWDIAVANRGVIYAPVYVTPGVVTAGFVYTPAYAIPQTVVVDTLFVRPAYCHYYFGDYYAPAYRSWGIEFCAVYSRRSYDPIYTYHVYEHRADPAFINVQINLFQARAAGTAPRPPRTLVEQNNIIRQNNTTIVNQTVVNQTVNNTTVNNIVMAAPASKVTAAQGMKTEQLTPAAKAQVRQQAQGTTQVVAQRQQAEVAVPKGQPIQPRTAKLAVPPAAPARPAATSSPGAAAAAHPAATPNRPAAGNTAAANPGAHPNPTVHPGQPGGPGTQPLRQPTVQRPQPTAGGQPGHSPGQATYPPRPGAPGAAPTNPQRPPATRPAPPPAPAQQGQQPPPKKDDKQPPM